MQRKLKVKKLRKEYPLTQIRERLSTLCNRCYFIVQMILNVQRSGGMICWKGAEAERAGELSRLNFNLISSAFAFLAGEGTTGAAEGSGQSLTGQNPPSQSWAVLSRMVVGVFRS